MLKKAHIILLPAVRQGWRLVVTESNAMGMPGIAYTVAGLLDSVRHGETGILVKENSPHELATSAICLLSDQDLLTKDTNNALTFSKLQLG
jgi:glycosyltransferase involved in cell wall biosynthesis